MAHPQLIEGDRSYLVAAVFLDDTSAWDAIADLKLAGFQAGDIGVALSEQGRQERVHGAGAKAAAVDPKGKHSIPWRIRHSVEHDVHSRGPVVPSSDGAAAVTGEDRPYTEFDLNDTLSSGLGIAPDTIGLLNRELGPDGILLLVNSRGRVAEVDFILDRNRGYLRTAMATERSHVTS